MDKLMLAVDEYNKALAEWNQYTSTYYAPWQLDEPITPGERRADEQQRRLQEKLRRRLQDAQAAVIAAAQQLHLAQPG
jgi:hypothetical protein